MTKTNPKTISVAVPTGKLEIPALWVGKNTALHRPVSVSNGGTKATRGLYALTHLESGLSFGFLQTNQKQAKSIARAWDDRCGTVDPTDASQWEHREAWAELLRNLNDVWTRTHMATTLKVRQQWGSQAPSNGESQELAMMQAANQGLAIDQGCNAKRIIWRGQSWPAPTEAELEHWTFDSVCETPDGRTVEPDHPESWLRILGLI